LEELRGKFIVNLIGNWSTAAYDWVDYATSGIRNRVAFPMQTIFTAAAEPPPEPVDPLTQLLEEFELREEELLTHAKVTVPAPPAPSHKWFLVTDTSNTVFWIEDISEDATPCPTIPRLLRQDAFRQSIFWQLEDLGEYALARAADFLTAGGVIRGHDAYKITATDWTGGDDSIDDIAKSCDQSFELSKGIQLIQTDYPWHVLNDSAPVTLGIPTDPSRRLRDKSSWAAGPAGYTSALYHEPGGRFYFHSRPLPTEVWAHEQVPPVDQRWWEATVSTTRNGDTWTKAIHWWGVADHAIPSADDFKLSYPRRAEGKSTGSIRVESDDGRDSVVIVRHKETEDGPTAYQENVIITVIVTTAGVQAAPLDYHAARYGAFRSTDDPETGDDVTWLHVGSLIALSVDNRGESAAVSAFSAGGIRDDGIPDWQCLGVWFFRQPLIHQGYGGSGDVLLAGPRTATSILVAAGIPGPPNQEVAAVRLSDLPGRRYVNTNLLGASLVDLTDPLPVPCPTISSIDFDGPGFGTTSCSKTVLVAGAAATLTVRWLDDPASASIAGRQQTYHWDIAGADVMADPQGRTATTLATTGGRHAAKAAGASKRAPDAATATVKLMVHNDVHEVDVTVTVWDNFGCKTSKTRTIPVMPVDAIATLDAICATVDKFRQRLVDLPSELWLKPGPDPALRRLQTYAEDLNRLADQLNQQTGRQE
jgi:hypothetical protein